MASRGKFISLEGGDGAGKSTQARTLAQRLRAKGIEVVLTREPGGSPLAERLRTALLSEQGRALEPSAQAILFAAARADHVTSVIAPALQKGDWVVCDRFVDSTEAYQGSGGASPSMMALLKRVAVGDMEPDVTFLLDLPPKQAIRRAEQRDALDPFEAEALAVHRARRNAFLEIAARDKERCVVVDAKKSPDEVADTIWATVTSRLLPAPAAA